MDKKLYVPLIDNGLGMVQADYMQSFLAAFSGVANVIVDRISDSHPGRGRNRAAANFLQGDCTHLLFIDTDILFKRYHVDCLNESDEAIIAGVYCLKTEETKLCLQTLPGFQPTPAGGLIEVARTGTGFLRIAREVFEAMKDKTAPAYYTHGRPEWDFFRSGVLNSDWLSEDWYFCEDARSLGFKVMVDTRIQLEHQGKINYPIKKTPDRLLYCPPAMKPHIEAIWKGEYEIELEKAPRNILDIGANIGGFAVWAKEQWPTSKIVCFEPHPDNFSLLLLNTKHIKDSETELNPCAVVGHCMGTVKLYFGENEGEHSTKFGEENEGIWVPAVEAKTINLESVDLIKLDCEGCELEILKDLSSVRDAKAIVLEYHSASDRKDIAGLLTGTHGFKEIYHRPITDNRGILKFKK